MASLPSNRTLGIVLPTNNPNAMYQYLLPSLENLLPAKKFVTFLINFQPPWRQEDIEGCCEEIRSYGFELLVGFGKYEVKGKGLVPINKIREDTAQIDPYCKYYMIFDDDMSFLGPSEKMPRCAGDQIVESLIYMTTNWDCGVLVFGGSLIKKIDRDSIAPISRDREYVTGRGIIFKNMRGGRPFGSVLVPEGAYELLGSDEEKVIAGWRLFNGLYAAEMPFVRINHYENQVSKRNKNGKIPGKVLYEWNTDEIKNSNNFKFIRENYNPDYASGKGNIVKSIIPYIDIDDQRYKMNFSGISSNDLQKYLEVYLYEH